MPNELTPTRGRGQPRKDPPPVNPDYVSRSEPPEDLHQKIERLAAEGCCSYRRLAAALKISRDVLSRWMSERQDLRNAFEWGKERHCNELVEIVMNDARDREKPNINAFMLLRTLHGFRDGEESDSGPRISVAVTLQAALSRDDYMKTVTSDDSRILEAHALPAARDLSPRRA